MVDPCRRCRFPTPIVRFSSAGCGGQSPPKTFNLSQRKVYEELSGRAWAESYLSLLRAGFRNQGKIGYHLAAYPNEYVDWISPQSGPAV